MPSEWVDTRSGAVLSEDREYRYRLHRTWDVDAPTVAFIMLNPSTADAEEDDPTIRRCVGFAEDWGYGTLVVGNLFAYRATDPTHLAGADDPVGQRNDTHLRRIEAEAERVVVAWGHRGDLQGRAAEVVDLLDGPLWALDTTQDGQPCHPLYQPADAELVRFDGGDGDAE